MKHFKTVKNELILNEEDIISAIRYQLDYLNICKECEVMFFNGPEDTTAVSIEWVEESN